EDAQRQNRHVAVKPQVMARRPQPFGFQEAPFDSHEKPAHASTRLSCLLSLPAKAGVVSRHLRYMCVGFISVLAAMRLGASSSYLCRIATGASYFRLGYHFLVVSRAHCGGLSV